MAQRFARCVRHSLWAQASLPRRYCSRTASTLNREGGNEQSTSTVGLPNPQQLMQFTRGQKMTKHHVLEGSGVGTALLIEYLREQNMRLTVVLNLRALFQNRPWVVRRLIQEIPVQQGVAVVLVGFADEALTEEDRPCDGELRSALLRLPPPPDAQPPSVDACAARRKDLYVLRAQDFGLVHFISEFRYAFKSREVSKAEEVSRPPCLLLVGEEIAVLNYAALIADPTGRFAGVSAFGVDGQHQVELPPSLHVFDRLLADDLFSLDGGRILFPAYLAEFRALIGRLVRRHGCPQTPAAQMN